MTEAPPAWPEPIDLMRHSRRPERNGSVDRLPPHSIEAEQGVLGCCLLASEACEEALEGLPDEAFYDLRHQHIFGTIRAMVVASVRIDPLTLMEALRSRQQLEACGGMSYLTALLDATPTAGHVKEYVATVQQKWLERSIIQTCTAAVASIYEGAASQDVLETLESDLTRMTAKRNESAVRPMKEIVHESINEIERLHGLKGQLSGIPSGYVDIDKMTGGWMGGDMIVIAGRPASGKTSLAMNMAEFAAVDHKVPVGVFSLEMTDRQIVTRMMLSRARINIRWIREGAMLPERDFPKLTGSAGRFAKAAIHIDDTSGLTMERIRSRARRMKRKHDIKLMVIDYLQLIMIPARGRESRNDAVAAVSNGIKNLAKELDIPIIVLSQMSRDIEKGTSKTRRKPRLSDLRDSGAIEADADLVAFLWNPDETDEDSDGSGFEAIPVNLIIEKQRNGPTGTVHLTFLKNYTRFESAAKVSAYDVPNQEPLQI